MRNRRRASRLTSTTLTSGAPAARPGVTRVVIAGKYPLVRLGLQWAIRVQPGLEVVGEARTGREAVALALSLSPDVVVLDSDLTELGVADATRRIRGTLPRTEILTLVVRGCEDAARHAYAAGARGFVLKSDKTSEIPAAIRSLVRHRLFFSRAADEVVRTGAIHRRGVAFGVPPSELSPREREVLRLVAEGRTTKEIAQDLGISPKTADVHRGSLMKKLDIHSVAKLVRYAICNAVIDV